LESKNQIFKECGGCLPRRKENARRKDVATAEQTCSEDAAASLVITQGGASGGCLQSRKKAH